MESTKLQITWPEIFITGKLPENYTKPELIADALTGWAHCSMRAEIPKNFGQGMAAISGILGTATPNGIDKLAEEFLATKKAK